MQKNRGGKAVAKELEEGGKWLKKIEGKVKLL